MTQLERIAELRQSLEDPYLSIGEIAAWVGLGPSTIHRMVRSGVFPRPTRIGPKTIRWRQKVIEDWIEQSNKPNLTAA